MLGVILDIILLILKIVGIILLVLLGIALSLLLTILFVPIRYKSEGRFAKENDGVKYAVSGKITWLLHIVSIKYVKGDNVNTLKIRLFGIDISKKIFKTNKPVIIDENKQHIKMKDIKNTEEIHTSDVSISVKEEKKEQQPYIVTQKETDKIFTEDNVNKSTGTKRENKTKKERISIIDKIRNIFEKICNICDKIKNINEVKKRFIEFLKSEKSKASIKEIKYIVLKILKHILPGKLQAVVKFGFENPETTGKVLGIISIFYLIYGDNLQLEPDFENQVLEGQYKLKGRIRLFTILKAAWKLYRNKWIREFISFSKKTVENI